MRVHSEWRDEKAVNGVAQATSPELWTAEAAQRWVIDTMASLGESLISISIEA